MTSANDKSGISRRTVVAGAAASTAFAITPLRHAYAAKPVKVGVLLPTSGALAFPSQACRRGIDFAAKVLQGNGAPAMQIIHVDTESKAEQGRVAAEKLIREGCSVLIGAFDSGTTISAAQAAEAAKVPLVVNIASAPQITGQGFQYVFRNFTPGTTLVFNAVQRIKELSSLTGYEPKTAVLMHVNDTFGQAVAKGVDILWGKLNVPIKILDKISYSRTARDMSVEIGKAKASNPDILMPITRVSDAILIVREMVKQNFNPKGIIGPGSPGPYEKAFTDATGKYGDEYITCVPWYDPLQQQTKDVIKAFTKEYPKERFELNVGFSYESVQIVADAIKRAGSGDPQAIRDALRTTKLTDHIMYGGPIEFDKTGQNKNIGGAMLQNQKGQPRVIGPAKIADAKPIFPMTPFAKR
jgi:branched-chain amino acid transport system substrate-binding protein